LKKASEQRIGTLERGMVRQELLLQS